MATETLDQKIATLTARKATLESAIAFANSDIPASQAYVRQMVAEGNLAEANKVSVAINDEDASRTGNIAELATINQSLPLLQQQKQIQLDAQNAVVTQANQNASSTLTADQQLQLQLAQLQSSASGKTAQATDQATIDADKAKTTKMYIIGGIVFAVIIIVGIAIFKFRKK